MHQTTAIKICKCYFSSHLHVLFLLNLLYKVKNNLNPPPVPVAMCQLFQDLNHEVLIYGPIVVKML